MRKISSLIYLILLLFFGTNISCRHGRQNLPNFVFIMSDDHAYQAISAYGSDLIETKNIDIIANQGIIFKNAFVTNSICAPSRAVILTGKHSHVNGILDNSQAFDTSQVTFPKILNKNGYQTAIIGKWHLKSKPAGFDYWNVLPGQGLYYNPVLTCQGKDSAYQGYVTEIITELSVNWLRGRDSKKPFCLMIHHKAPHRNWMPSLEKLEHFDDQEFPLPETFYDDYQGRNALQHQQLTIKDHMDIRWDFKVCCDSCDAVPVNRGLPGAYGRILKRFSPDERERWEHSYKKEEEEFLRVKDSPIAYDQWKYRRYMEDYLRCIESVDESIGEILGFLKENDLEKNTVVIYTSDQGFFLGEHGLFDKRFMYEEAMRTPLMIRYPEEIGMNSKTGLLVQNLDIAPTLLDLAGIDIPTEMQGRSLRELWRSPGSDWREALYYRYYESGWGTVPHYGIRTNRFKLIHFQGAVDTWELFDLENDPKELSNLYSDPEYDDIKQNLIVRLTELRQKYRDTIITI